MNLDVFQMQQCENQGRLFESLDRRPIDAKTFIKAFMHSRAAAGLDSTFDHFQWAGIEYIYEDVVEEFNLQPDSNPLRYNTEALWYGGYITRYWHYLTSETMKQIYAQCDENLLLQCYGFHSEANEMAIEDIKAIARNKENPRERKQKKRQSWHSPRWRLERHSPRRKGRRRRRCSRTSRTRSSTM